VQLIPALLGVWLGAGASNAGDPRGLLPMRIALIAVLSLLALATFRLLLAIMVGATA
jgi:hypothetical protein